MKWVKASERMPEKEGNYFIKVKGIEYQEDETVEYECGTYLHFVNTFQGKYSPALSKNETVVEWLDESSPSDNTQSIDTELAGKIWDAAEEFSNECWCGQCDYCNTVSKRPPDKETFINSLNLDNTQIRDVEDMALNYAANFGKSKPEQFTDEQVGRLHGFIDGYNAAILPTPPND